MEFHKVNSVKPLADFKLDIEFDDGQRFVFEMKPLLEGEIFSDLKVPAKFNQASVDPISGNVMWPNGADLDSQVLYYEDMRGQSIQLPESVAK